jgi:hypothetical protein
MASRISRRDLFGGVLAAIAAWLVPGSVQKRSSSRRAQSVPQQPGQFAYTSYSYWHESNPQLVTRTVYDAQGRAVAIHENTAVYRYWPRG